MLDEICATIHRFVWLKPSQCRAVALWVVLTYLHDAVDILPILLTTSPEEACGKTSLLKLVFYLSNRPVPAGNISAAAIYRTIKDIAPTMTLDEADTYLKDNEEMRGVIDSGHESEFAWVPHRDGGRGHHLFLNMVSESARHDWIAEADNLEPVNPYPARP